MAQRQGRGCQTVVLEAPVLGDRWEGPPEELSRFPWVEGWDPTRMYDPDGRFFGTAEDDLATPIFYAEPEVIERLGRRIEGRTAGPETTLIWSIDGSVGG